MRSDNSPITSAVEKVQAEVANHTLVQPSNKSILDPEMVFLLDEVNGNLIFRGNSPLTAKTETNPDQLIDFSALQAAMAVAYEKKMDSHFPYQDTTYELCVVALVGEGDGILSSEVQSFGGQDSDLSREWYPSLKNGGYPINIDGNEIKARITQWNIGLAEPIPTDPNLLMGTELAKKLNTWVNVGLTDSKNEDPVDKTIKRVIYMHCANGHDRTGLMCNSYLNQKVIEASGAYMFNKDDVTTNYILGTTLNKVPYSGGPYAKDCYDLDCNGEPTSQESGEKSRCFLTSPKYDDTVLKIADSLAGKPLGTFSLGVNAVSGNANYPNQQGKKVYVDEHYAFLELI